MSDVRSDDMGPWLSPDDLDLVRRKVPMVYVDVVPVRLDADGVLQRVGVLLRTPREGGIWRTFVSGRVLLHETIRAAVARHVEKDLGPMALPRLPMSLVPFAVNEYFPTPALEDVQGHHDSRQHAVSLAYVVPVQGDVAAQGNALQLDWLTPAEALEPSVAAEMVSGHGALLTAALAHLGRIP